MREILLKYILPFLEKKISVVIIPRETPIKNLIINTFVIDTIPVTAIESLTAHRTLTWKHNSI